MAFSYSQQNGRNAGKRIPALDGLRGFAALVMVLYHLFVAGWATSPMLHLVQKFVTAGWVGVDLFFVLSGFLITGILLRALSPEDPHQREFSSRPEAALLAAEAERPASVLRSFYARRALRIFPLYYLVVFFAIAFPALLRIQWSGLQWLYLADLQNNVGLLLMRPCFLAHPPDLSAIEHLWTLALEEQFYLVWPLVIFLCRDRRTLLTGSLVACAAALALRILLWSQGVGQDIVANATPCRFDALLIGSCLAIALGLSPAVRDRTARLAKPVCLATLATMLVVAFARNTWANEDPFVYTVGFTLLDVFFAALILIAARPGSRTGNLFSIAPLRVLGTYSYGLYIYHELLAQVLKVPLRNTFDAHHSKLFGVLASAAVLLLLSIAVAVASHHLFEQPFLRLKRRFPYGSGL